MNMSRIRRLDRWLAPCGLLLLASGAALATSTRTPSAPQPEPEGSIVHVYPTIPTQPLAVVAEAADQIVHGRVLAARQVSGANVLDHMEFDFQVDTSLKGEAPEMISIWLTGSPQLVVDGSPRLDVGQELILFTHPMATGHAGILGLSQGCYRVERSANGNHQVRGTQAPEGTQLADFVQRIETGLAQSEAKEVR